MKRWLERWTRVVVFGAAAALSACGGGGGGSSAAAPSASGTSSNDVIITMAPQSAAIRLMDGVMAAPVELTGTLRIAPSVQGFYVFVEGDEQVLLNVDIALPSNDIQLSLQFSDSLAPGDHVTELVVHACADDQCTRELGPPVTVPVAFHVDPNIEVQRQVVLTRTGRDAAPSVVLPVTIPPQAGTLVFSIGVSAPWAMDVSFDGTALRVNTKQAQAGTYTTYVELASTVDSRYRRGVNIEYTVLAPAGGERPLSVDVPYSTLSVAQGARVVRRVQVTRPTWTDAWVPPTLVGNNADMASLRDLGGDVYEVTIDAAGRPVGSYDVGLRFDAGPTGGQVTASFSVSVEDVFTVTGLDAIDLNSSTTLADLTRTLQVRMVDGSTRRWTLQPSADLVATRTSGLTGVDGLQLSPSATFLRTTPYMGNLPVTVSVDLPGSLPRTVRIPFNNSVLRLNRSAPATLVGTTARAYVQGWFTESDSAWASHLQVTGGTLIGAQLLSDRRFLGTQAVLGLDLKDLVPGQPVVVRYDHAVVPTQVQFNVLAPLTTPVAYQALPFDRYRPVQFAPGVASLYFTGTDTVYRWALSGGNWSLNQVVRPGVLDAMPAADETLVYVTDATRIYALDPVALAVQSSAVLSDGVPFVTWTGFDAGPAASHGLVMAADGRALSSLTRGPTPSHGVAWVCPVDGPESGTVLLTNRPGTCDTGTGFSRSNEDSGFGLARSANGETVVAVGPQGGRQVYATSSRVWAEQASLPAGYRIVAVSDDGARTIRNDGILLINDIAWGSFNSVIPLGYDAGGYALTGDGRFGLVYGYRRTGTGAAERAADATVWVVDLRTLGVPGLTSAAVLASIALPQPVGCSTALATGETCLHEASLTVAPGQQSVFVIGPRGVAAVPLPATTVATVSARASAQLQKASFAPRAPQGSMRLRRAARVHSEWAR